MNRSRIEEPGAGADERLDYLRRPALARLFAAVRERRERLGRVGGRVRLPAATPEERRALAELFALPTLPADPIPIDLTRLDRVLRESRLGIGLEEALNLLGGPLRDLHSERTEARRSWESLWAEAAEQPLVRGHPPLGRWLDQLRRDGGLRRAAREGDPAQLLSSALAVLAELDRLGPLRERSSAETMGLPVLASRALGSSHGLDFGRKVANLVLRALAVLAGRPAPLSSADRRELWEWAGVVSDELSCDVLALGLAPKDLSPLADALRALSGAGEPFRLTLRQLGTHRLSFPAGLSVRVCENPIVVAAAADRWGAAVAPLVCVGGQPSQAGRRMLEILVGQGAKLLYHGDFDWGGLRIAGGLLRSLPLAPWRFGAADYRRAVESGAAGPPLAGEPAAAPWDAELATAMASIGLAVEEEAVLEELVADLGREGER